MSDFNPEEYFNKYIKPKQKFNPEEYFNKYIKPKQKKEKEMGVGESALKGAQQGLTWGFSDEAVGVIDQMLKASGGLFTPEGTVNPYANQTYSSVYKKARDEERAELKKAQEDNPLAYLGGEIAGSLVAPAGVAANRLSKGAQTAKEFAKATAKIGALEGGVYGLGASEKKDVAGMAKDAASGAALGLVTGGLLGGGFGALASKYRRATAKSSLPKEVTEEFDGELSDQAQDVAYSELLPEPAIRRAEKEAVENKKADQELFDKIYEMKPEKAIDIKSGSQQDTLTAQKFMEFVLSRADKIDESSFRKEIKTIKEKDIITEVFGKSDIQELVNKAKKNPKEAVILQRKTNQLARKLESALKEGSLSTKIQTSLKVLRHLNEVGFNSNVNDIVVSAKAYRNSIAQAFEKAKDQGMVTREVWNEFKLGQYLLRQMDKEDAARKASMYKGLEADSPEFVKQSVKHYDLQNPLRWGSKYWMDANVGFRKIDDEVGSDLELIQNRLYDQTNKKKGFDRAVQVVLGKAQKARDKSKLTDEEIVKVLEGRADPALKSRMTKEDLRAVEGYRTTLKYLLHKSRGAGLNIKARENYVPLRKKTGVDMITALENRSKEVGLLNGRNQYLDDMMPDIDWQAPDDELLESLSKLTGNERDIGFIRHYTEKLYNTTFETTNELRDAIKNLRTSEMLQRTTQPELSAAFARKSGDLPDWAREYNIDKLIWKNTDEASHAAFVLPAARALDSRAAALSRLGMEDAASVVRSYRMEVSGIQRPKGKIDVMSNYLKNKMAFLGEDKDSDIIRAVPHMIDVMASSIYPNIIGFNAKAVLRNLTQPLTMTTAEMGWIPSSKIWADSSAQLMSDMIKAGNGNPFKGWSKIKRKMVSEGTIPESVRAQDFEGIRSGVADWSKSRGIKAGQKAIDNYSKAAMFMFGKTDEWNRMTTKYMADKVADEIINKRYGKGAKFKNKLPKSVRSKIEALQNSDKPFTAEKEIKDIVRRWMLVQTQLAYGKVGSNELGRMFGPGITMLTKWPVAITSDIAYKAGQGRKGAAAIFTKYFGPAIALSLLGQAMYDREAGMSRAQKELIGSSGLPGWLPITSLFSADQIAVPVNLSTPLELGSSLFSYGTSELEGQADQRDRRKIKRAFKRAVQQYVPVFGGTWRAYEHVVDGLINNEDSRNK